MPEQAISEIWIITGTSSGLGNAIALNVLQRTGALVYGFARKNTITHKNYFHQQIDLSDFNLVNSIQLPEIPATVKHLVLINNAGGLGEMLFAGKLENHIINSTYTLNIITPHILSNQFLNQYGEITDINKCIINVSSGAAKTPYAGWSIYCSTKAAIDMMTLCLVQEQAQLPKSQSTRIFALAPGVIDTAMQAQIRNADESGFTAKNKFVELHKNQQLYNVHDVAIRYVHLALNIDSTQEPIQRVTL